MRASERVCLVFHLFLFLFLFCAASVQTFTPLVSPLRRELSFVVPSRRGLLMDETDEEAFYLEQVTLEDDDDDEFDYTEVVVEDDEDEGFGEDVAEDEDLEQALKTLKTREDGLPLVQEDTVPRSAITRRPEVLDDFIRNVLLKMGMVRERSPPPARGVPGSDD